nr:CHRD domain-containing protein [Shewanella salipaludis]
MLIATIIFALPLAGCFDSNNTRRVISPPPPPPPNTTTITASLDSDQVITGGAATGSANATFTLNLDTNALSGTVTLTDITADTVTLNQGYAGEVGELLATLQSDSSSQWSIPSGTVLSAENLALLNSGGLYLQVDNAASGALRGQILVGNIQLILTNLSGSQEVPAVVSSGSAKGAITLDPDSGAIIVHLNAVGLDDATSSHVHQALAGVSGGVIFALSQDTAALGHWSATDVTLDSEQLANLNKGAYYLNLHTPANPGGEVRGQIQPEGIEVFFTNLSGADVVPPVVTANSGITATTVQIASQLVDIHVNLQGLDDATSVTVNQAPVGQNGPAIFSLVQDSSNLAHWSLDNQATTSGQYTAFVNQGLYVTATSPLNPAGEVRGQLEPEISSPGSGAVFVVSAITPANGATIAALPASIDVTFNRPLLASTVSLARIELLASGGDGSFNDGNEITLTPANAVVAGASLNIDLSGVLNADDVYRLTLDGSSATPLTDTAGIVLDGDADNNAGGDFVSTFTVSTPAVIVTLTSLQTEIFTPSCALSGCHAGASPQQGMNLSAGQTYSNIVGVMSNEVNSLNRVTAGDPDNSYLVQKVEGTASVGGRMPLGGPALSNEQIQKIRQWIIDGAKDD